MVQRHDADLQDLVAHQQLAEAVEPAKANSTPQRRVFLPG